MSTDLQEDDLETIFFNCLEDFGIAKDDADCYTIARLLKIELKKYSELSDADRQYFVSKNQFGISARMSNRNIICYNDSLSDWQIEKTIWHEIGHYILGHHELGCNVNHDYLETQADYIANLAMNLKKPCTFNHKELQVISFYKYFISHSWKMAGQYERIVKKFLKQMEKATRKPIAFRIYYKCNQFKFHICYRWYELLVPPYKNIFYIES